MTILQEADTIIHGERQSTYGHVLDEYTRFAGMVNATFAQKLSAPLTAEDMLLFMVLLKLNRLTHDVTHRDSQIDAAGYIGLIEEVQKRRDTPSDPSL